MPFFKSTKSLSVALGISFCGVGGLLIYHYLKNGYDRTATVRIVIPSAYVGLIIGRRGNRVKELQSQTGATIIFDQERIVPNTDVTCIISGSSNAVCMAEYSINAIMNEEKANLCEQMSVPEHTVGSLIGHEGSTIKAICNATGAQVNVGKGGDKNTEKERRITLKGSREQIDAAKDCIQDIVVESEELMLSMGKREPRTHSKYAIEERLGSIAGSASPFEVYVSAMVDPSRFWLQIVGPKAQQLDLLVEEMTEFYKVPENRGWHKLQSVEEGDLVAATFMYDERWYRAEVLALNETKDIAELYYVDYGDTEKVATTDLYELKVNYLQLHFQAIECFLSRIEPVQPDQTWTCEAIDRFEEWAHVAQWRKLSAKVANYSWRERTRAKRGSSPVPGVELFDVVNDTDINIGEELVRQGYAVHSRTGESSRSSSSVDWERY